MGTINAKRTQNSSTASVMAFEISKAQRSGWEAKGGRVSEGERVAGESGMEAML